MGKWKRERAGRIYTIKLMTCIIHSIMARRKEFPEGGGGGRRLASRQGVWGIWSKILQSSNFHALLSKFRKVLFFKNDF